MKKSIAFFKRNLLEYLRSPLMLFFTLIFPILMFFVFQLIKIGTGATDDIVPMFETKNLIASICVFSFSFIALNLSTQISKDRNSAFQTRLKVSPLTPLNFFVGYFLPCLIIAIIQIILCFLVGFCFGLKLDINILFAFLTLAFISFFYISVGILIGSLCNEKACGGISSIFVNATAIFSGMFFPLTTGTFKTILSFFPFLPSVALPQTILNNTTENLLLYFIVIVFYTILAFLLSSLAFKRKLKNA